MASVGRGGAGSAGRGYSERSMSEYGAVSSFGSQLSQYAGETSQSEVELRHDRRLSRLDQETTSEDEVAWPALMG
jgi:hypothetical protein